MKPEERLRIASVLSGLLGFAEGQMRGHNWAIGWLSEEKIDKLIAEEPYFERARELLRELEGACGESEADR